MSNDQCHLPWFMCTYLLSSGDDGFGDVPLDPHTPEMLRDVSALGPDYGPPDSVSLAPESGRDYSLADDDYHSVRFAGLWIRVDLMLIRIQFFLLIADPDPGF